MKMQELENGIWQRIPVFIKGYLQNVRNRIVNGEDSLNGKTGSESKESEKRR